jgi:hypothetical protein
MSRRDTSPSRNGKKRPVPPVRNRPEPSREASALDRDVLLFLVMANERLEETTGKGLVETFLEPEVLADLDAILAEERIKCPKGNRLT